MFGVLKRNRVHALWESEEGGGEEAVTNILQQWKWGKGGAVHKHIIAVALRGEEVDHETFCSCGIGGEEVVKDVEVSAGNILVIHIVRFYCYLKIAFHFQAE